LWYNEPLEKVDGDDSEDDPEDEPKEKDGARGKEAANVVIELGRLPSLLPVLAKCGYPSERWHPLTWS
jgi:hypothetical protein